MDTAKKVLITGAAGNLGGLLAAFLQNDPGVSLNLLAHKKPVDAKLAADPSVKIFKADLADPQTLYAPLESVDTIVHFAGVLFKHNPEKFLHTTNTKYFNNLLDIAVKQNVKRIILISFPHVEGETTPDNPAKGILTGNPQSVHASTRLEEEKLLFSYGKQHGIEPVSLRVGMVYGRGILMIDAARWFSKYRLLGIWRKPTHIHLISTADFLEATKAAILKPGINGIYHIGDEGVVTLQEFLDAAARQWGYWKPWRMPPWMIFTAARTFELWSHLFGTRAPLTRDFIRIGMASYYGDTARMRTELLPQLTYRTYKDGLHTL